MRVQHDTGAVHEMLVDALPRELLWFISVNPGVTTLQLVSAVLQWLPRHIEPRQARYLTQGILADLAARGDLSRVPGGRYMALPPLAIECATRGSGCVFRLFGNPLLDAETANRLHVIGGRLAYGEAKSNNASVPVLLDRTAERDVGKGDIIGDLLAEAGYHVLLSHEMQAQLPKVADVKTPPVDTFRRITPLRGSWEAYSNSKTGVARWVSIPKQDATEEVLLRWHDSERIYESRNVNYYLCSGQGLVHAISSEKAILWKLRLDVDWAKPGDVILQTDCIKVRLPIPRVYRYWLQAQSFSLTKTTGEYLVANVESRSLAEVASILHGYLGLAVRGDAGGES